MGCGRYVYGHSEEEVIERWNNGETDGRMDKLNVSDV
jgi:hypothetical protein